MVVLEQTPAISLHPREEHQDQAGNRLETGWTGHKEGQEPQEKG